MGSLVGFQHAGIKVETKYSVEFIAEYSENGADRWRRIQGGKHSAPWELYDVKEFEDAGDAVEFLILGILNDRVYDIKPVFEQIIVNGETAMERYLDCSETIRYRIRNMVDAEFHRKLEKVNRDLEDAKHLIAEHEEFVDRNGAGDLFRRFQKERIDGKC